VVEGEFRSSAPSEPRDSVLGLPFIAGAGRNEALRRSLQVEKEQTFPAAVWPPHRILMQDASRHFINLDECYAGRGIFAEDLRSIGSGRQSDDERGILAASNPWKCARGSGSGFDDWRGS
jgi:hypothetical protein